MRAHLEACERLSITMVEAICLGLWLPRAWLAANLSPATRVFFVSTTTRYRTRCRIFRWRSERVRI